MGEGHREEREATLEGVKVSRLSSYLEGYRYHLCRDSADEVEEKRRRESLLEDLRGWRPGSRSDGRYHRRIGDWKEMAERFLCEVYSLRQTADAISQRYFDGHQALFPSEVADFAKLVERIEKLAEWYNEDFANEPGQRIGSSQEGLPAVKPSNLIETTSLEERVAPAARQHTTFLVDMAKAEVLDALGENQAAVTVIDRHV